MSISDASASCLRGFDLLASALATADSDHRQNMPPKQLENEHGRFKVWAGNLGALQIGRSSLDFRLRESTVMQSNVLKLLHQLHSVLNESFAVASGLRLPFEKHPRPENFSDESSEEDDDDEDDDDEDDEGESDETTPIKTELEQRLISIIEILADLYKLSFRIRNPSLRPKPLRAILYKETDKETGVDTFSVYSDFDRRHVNETLKQLRQDIQQSHSDADDRHQRYLYLTDRLSNAMTNRRRVLRYWRKHANKLASEQQHIVAEVAGLPTLPTLDSDMKTPKIPVEREAMTLATAASSAGKTLLSGTEATTYERKLDDMLETQSVISYATTYDLEGNVIDLPPPPAAALTGKDFVCPYCGVLCPSRHGQGRAWRAHVLQDLQPYVCTYAECTDYQEMYSSRTAWLEHERLAHRRVWQCFEHRDCVFKGKAGLKEHLHAEHSEHATESQIKNLLDVSESSVADERRECPICLAAGPFPKGLDNHISFHLEKLATFSLPGDLFDNEEIEPTANGGSSRAQGESQRLDGSLGSVSLQFRSQPSSQPSSQASSQAGYDNFETVEDIYAAEALADFYRNSMASGLKKVFDRVIQAYEGIISTGSFKGRPCPLNEFRISTRATRLAISSRRLDDDSIFIIYKLATALRIVSEDSMAAQIFEHILSCRSWPLDFFSPAARALIDRGKILYRQLSLSPDVMPPQSPSPELSIEEVRHRYTEIWAAVELAKIWTGPVSRSPRVRAEDLLLVDHSPREKGKYLFLMALYMQHSLGRNDIHDLPIMEHIRGLFVSDNPDSQDSSPVPKPAFPELRLEDSYLPRLYPRTEEEHESKIPGQAAPAQLRSEDSGKSLDGHQGPDELSAAMMAQALTDVSQSNYVAPADATRGITSQRQFSLRWICHECYADNAESTMACSICAHTRCRGCLGTNMLEMGEEESRKSVDTYQGPSEPSEVASPQVATDASQPNASPVKAKSRMDINPVKLSALNQRLLLCCSCLESMGEDQRCIHCGHEHCSNCSGPNPLKTAGEESSKSVGIHQGMGELSEAAVQQLADIAHRLEAPSDPMSMLGSASAQMAVGEARQGFDDEPWSPIKAQWVAAVPGRVAAASLASRSVINNAGSTIEHAKAKE